MTGDREARRQHASEAARASADIEHTIALLAPKVMMVLGGHRGWFIAIGLTRDENRRDRPVAEKTTDNPVDRPDAESGHLIQR